MNIHHTRSSYEQLYSKLTKENNVTPIPKVESLSDFQLLKAINRQLIDLNCVPFEGEDWEVELH